MLRCTGAGHQEPAEEERWLKGQRVVRDLFEAGGIILDWSCSGMLSSWPSLAVHLAPSYSSCPLWGPPSLNMPTLFTGPVL